MTNYEKIRQACFSANPKILELSHEPQLSDVLLVIEKLYWSNEFANEAGYDWYVRQLLKRYNLANPLKDQSEETLKYITNLYEELQKIASLHNPL